MRRFTLGSATSRKIVVIELNGARMSVVQMMEDGSSTRQQKELRSEDEARSASEKLAHELISRGYVEQGSRRLQANQDQMGPRSPSPSRGRSKTPILTIFSKTSNHPSPSPPRCSRGSPRLPRPNPRPLPRRRPPARRRKKRRRQTAATDWTSACSLASERPRSCSSRSSATSSMTSPSSPPRSSARGGDRCSSSRRAGRSFTHGTTSSLTRRSGRH